MLKKKKKNMFFNDFKLLEVGLTEAKMIDVESLLKYLSPKGQQFFTDYFASITVK